MALEQQQPQAAEQTSSRVYRRSEASAACCKDSDSDRVQTSGVNHSLKSPERRIKQ